jgi:hypothetical protein
VNTVWDDLHTRLANVAGIRRYTPSRPPSQPEPEHALPEVLAETWPGFHLLADRWEHDTPALLSIGSHSDRLTRALWLAAHRFPVLLIPGTTTKPAPLDYHDLIDGGLMFIVPRGFAQWAEHDVNANDTIDTDAHLLTTAMPADLDDLHVLTRLSGARNPHYLEGDLLAALLPELNAAAALTGISRGDLLDIALPLWSDTGGDYAKFLETVDTAVTVIRSGSHTLLPANR